jgi:hypothetical protein
MPPVHPSLCHTDFRDWKALIFAGGCRSGACRAGFAIATAPASNRLRQCGKPGYQSRFEPMTGTLETFVTLAAIQLAIRRLART